MRAALNNVATADGYRPAATLLFGPAGRLRVRVRNASVYRQFGYGSAGAPSWEDEVFMPMGADDALDESDRPFTAVRFRSATPNTPARVTAEAIGAEL